MTQKKLKFIPYGQATILEENSCVLLKSYNTVVAKIENNIATCFGLYSRTTIKHLSAFAREYGFSYYDLKRCYKENLSYYIKQKIFVSNETGEILGE